jgi:acyl-CoA synthetase (AMP-forming)/AMP-acid ligase II
VATTKLVPVTIKIHTGLLPSRALPLGFFPTCWQVKTTMQNNIGLLITKRTELNPDRQAFVEVHTGLRLSYTELNQRINRIANALVNLGVKKGDRVALLQMNGIAFVETFYGIAKIGAVVVPLNWRLVADELEFILRDSGSLVLLFGTEFAELACDLQSRAGKTRVQHWFAVGAEELRPEFAGSYAGLVADAAFNEPAIAAAEDDNLYIMYTSGTTGLPKGVVHTHNTAMWSLITGSATNSFYESDRYLLALPLFHVGALNPLNSVLYHGGTVVVMRAFDATETWETIEQEKITTLLAVPSMLSLMLAVLEINRYDYSSVRWCMSGAAPVPKSLIESYARINFNVLQVYGLTESCGPACLIDSRDAITRVGSTGKAFFHTSVRIVDEQFNDVPANAPGEVIVAGKHIMKCYWNRPDATAETLVNGWLRTGDIAHRDEEGFIYIRDRLKDMIISGGENIYPAEIENILLMNARISDAAVIGQASEKWGESPFAVLVKKDESLTENEVLAFCKGKMGAFKLPKGAAFVESIPRNPSGKILKRLLREQFPGPARE